jgi:hypothetical protein
VELLFGFCAFLRSEAAGHDGGAEARGEAFWKLVVLLVAVYVDRFAGGVHDHFAVMAGPEVFFDFHK